MTRDVFGDDGIQKVFMSPSLQPPPEGTEAASALLPNKGNLGQAGNLGQRVAVFSRYLLVQPQYSSVPGRSLRTCFRSSCCQLHVVRSLKHGRYACRTVTTVATLCCEWLADQQHVPIMFHLQATQAWVAPMLKWFSASWAARDQRDPSCLAHLSGWHLLKRSSSTTTTAGLSSSHRAAAAAARLL